ncbi:hypothetical protein L3V64_013385, partial [Geobacillus stearothermophilus]|uniref:hypothetical protein n=1 Tax=Geobacillus stearothermophilus TaxID=1422 RepID=UPI001F3C5CE7
SVRPEPGSNSPKKVDWLVQRQNQWSWRTRFVSFSFQGTIALLGCKEFHFLINPLSLASSFFILT